MAPLTRREFLAAAAGAAASWCRAAAPSVSSPLGPAALGDELQRRSFSYFEERTDPGTGLTLDRGCTDGGPYTLDNRPTASTGVTGFGLAAFCIAAERGWMGTTDARERVRTALRFFDERAPHKQGWFYHWMHLRTGQRAGALAAGSPPSEFSTIDTALLLAGVLTAGQYFGDDAEIAARAAAIYRRVDFAWMLEPSTGLLRHGWTPEGGFIPYVWDEYSEAAILYLLAIGSPTHPIPPRSWYAWRRNPNEYAGYRYIGTTPLFTYQYSHAFVDFRGRRDRHGSGVDWFANSATATLAQHRFCMDLSSRFPGYSPTIWGITSSRSAAGYTDWGGPPLDPRIDGTVVPAAAGGSFMFEPGLCGAALAAMRRRYGAEIYCRYGFTDSFNPCTGWISPDVTGLNLGITLLSIENARSGNLWRWFGANARVRRALELAGFA